MQVSHRGKVSMRPLSAACMVLCVLSALRFASASADETTPRSLFIMNTDGTEVRHVLHVAGFRSLGSPRFAHDGRRLVFAARNPNADKNRLFAAGIDGAGLVDVSPGAWADWSPDDKQVAFSAGSSTALEQGIWVQNIDGRGRSRMASGVAPRWSPDGSRLAFILGSLKLLDLADGSTRELLPKLQDFKTVRHNFDWSPDGRRLAAVVEFANQRRAVLIVDAESESPQARVRLESTVNDVTWSPDGKTLAVSILDEATREHRIHLLPADGDEAPQAIAGQEGDNREPAWSPDGKQLAFASSRGDIAWKPAVELARQASLEPFKSFDSGGTCYSLDLAPDGRTALLGGNLGNRHMKVWDVQTGEVLRDIDLVGIFVDISPNGKEAACWVLPRTTVTYFNLEDGATLREFDQGGMVIFLSFSGDGSRIVCGSRDGMVKVFDVTSGQPLVELKHEQPAGNGALSPDGSLVATSAENKVFLWEAASGKKLREIEHPAMVWGLAFSPDGARLATGTGGTPIGNIAEQKVPVGDDNTIRLWNVADGRLVRDMKGHEHVVSTLAFSPNGRRLASGGFDKTLRLWDVESGQELDREGGESWIMKVVFSNDGSQVLTSGGNRRDSPDARRMIDTPEERVRVYRVVGGPTPTEAPGE
ncbi:MAG: hypothetical protein AB7O59_05905 [Pirellulales bacterium]